MKKSKFLGKVLAGLGCLTLIGGAGLGITYLVNPGLVQGWFGQAQEQPDNPDKPTPPEEYGEEIKDFQINGETIEGYTGADVVLNNIPTSYDVKVGEIKDEMVFNTLEEFEQQEHEFFNRSNNKAYYVTPNGYERTLCKTEAEWQAFSEVFASSEESLLKAFPLKFEFAERTLVKGNTYKVSQIGTSAFSGNTILMEITIPTEIKEIYHSAFKGCTSLQKVVLSENITSLSPDVFANCTSLENINLDHITEYQRGCLSGTKITELNITNGNIVSLAFTNMLELRAVTIADGVKIISDAENSLFENCPNLENVTISSSTIEPGIIVNLFKNGFGEKNKVYVPDDYFALNYELFKAYSNNIYPINGVYPEQPVETKIEEIKDLKSGDYSGIKVDTDKTVLDLREIFFIDLPVKNYVFNTLEEFLNSKETLVTEIEGKQVYIHLQDGGSMGAGCCIEALCNQPLVQNAENYPLSITSYDRTFYNANGADDAEIDRYANELRQGYEGSMFGYLSQNLSELTNQFLSNCPNLETLILPNNINLISTNFTNCPNLKNVIYISDVNVLQITSHSITIPENINYYVNDNMFDRYQSEDCWTNNISQIHRISEYQGELNI